MIAITRPWALYNEIDDYAADWLEELIALGAIAPGIVDRRSIDLLTPEECRGFRQVHFFAGIGVWSYALRRSGVSDDTHLWTGSCPCQPFSAAGKRGGLDDERHLWPAWFHLIRECRPREIFGEQVASKDGLGWLDLVWDDMEGADYAFWSPDTCSAGSGAPHIRQRLRFVAYDLRSAAGGVANMHEHGRHQGRQGQSEAGHDGSFVRPVSDDSGSSGSVEWMADHQGSPVKDIAERTQSDFESRPAEFIGIDAGADGRDGGRDRPSRSPVGRSFGGRPAQSQWVDDLLGEGLEGLGSGPIASIGHGEGSLRPVAATGELGGLAERASERRQRREIPQDWDVDHGQDAERSKGISRSAGSDETGGGLLGHNGGPNWPGPTNGFWLDADWLLCRDGKWRPVEPGTFPLVDGSAFRVGSGSAFEGKSRQGMLKAYGNAIDAEATVDFISAYLERDLVVIDHEPTRAVDPFADLLG